PFGTSTSLTLYVIAVPFSSYLSKSLKLYTQSSFEDTLIGSPTSLSLASSWTFTYSGRYWSSASSQTFSPDTFVSPTRKFVMSLPSIYFSYPSTFTSSTVYSISSPFLLYFGKLSKVNSRSSEEISFSSTTSLPFFT